MSGLRIPAQYIINKRRENRDISGRGDKKRKIVQIVEKTEYF